MRIGGLQKTSMLDYPSKISAIVFTNSCNFRCDYCHNPELFNQKMPFLNETAFFDFLKKRINKLDAVVITGGEPTLQNDLENFISKIKELNFLVKLDTNGSNPHIVENLLNKNLLDYIAMDIKAPLHKYKDITNFNIDTKIIQQSINLIMNSKIDYEFRTTVVKSQLTYDDFEKIGQLIKNANAYYLQKFIPSKTLNPEFMHKTTYNDNEFKEITEILKKYILNVNVR